MICGIELEGLDDLDLGELESETPSYLNAPAVPTATPSAPAGTQDDIAAGYQLPEPPQAT